MSEQPAQPSGNLPMPGKGTGPDGSAGRPAPALPDEQRQARDPEPLLPGQPPRRPSPSARSTASGADRPQERLRGTAGDRLDQAADAVRRMGHRARDQGGVAARAEPIAYRVGESFQSAADYVRVRDLHGMRKDVETGVRSAPIKSLAAAVAVGFLLGRVLR